MAIYAKLGFVTGANAPGDSEDSVSGTTAIQSGDTLISPDSDGVVTLGTTAIHDVQNNEKDSTVDSVMLTGAFGAGGYSTEILGETTQFIGYHTLSPEVPEYGGGIQVCTELGKGVQFYQGRLKNLFYSRISHSEKDETTPWDIHYTSSNPHPENPQSDLPVDPDFYSNSYTPTFGHDRQARTETIYKVLNGNFALHVGNMFNPATGPKEPQYKLRAIFSTSTSKNFNMTIIGDGTRQIYDPKGILYYNYDILTPKADFYVIDIHYLPLLNAALISPVIVLSR